MEAYRDCSAIPTAGIPRACMLMVCSKAPETKSALPPINAWRDFAPPAKSTISTSRPSSLK